VTPRAVPENPYRCALEALGQFGFLIDAREDDAYTRSESLLGAGIVSCAVLFAVRGRRRT
jgi:hypothetical protein